jgi:hypothetical protein
MAKCFALQNFYINILIRDLLFGVYLTASLPFEFLSIWFRLLFFHTLMVVPCTGKGLVTDERNIFSSLFISESRLVTKKEVGG